MRKQRSVVEDTRGGAAGGWTTDLPHLVELHRGFVWQQARRYARYGVPVEDLVQAGFIGLLTAALKYEPGRGANFLTYSRPWIRRDIGFELARMARPFRVPTTAAFRSARVTRTAHQFVKRHGREPTLEEMAAETGLTPRQIGNLEDLRVVTEIPLDGRSSGDGDGETGRSVGEVIPDPRSDPAQEVEDKLRAEAALRALAKLPPRERFVIVVYFGLDGAQERDSAALALEMGVSRQRIHQLKTRGLERLRAALPGWD